MNLVADMMLPQQQIFHTVILQKGQQPGKQLRIVLCLHTQMDVHFPLIRLFQGIYALAVIGKAFRPHPESGIIVPREKVWGVVGKAQNLHPRFQSTLHIGFVCSFRVSAAIGMCVIIGNHLYFLSPISRSVTAKNIQ